MSLPAGRGYSFDSFSDFLASTLRVGTTLRVYHVFTPPTPTTSIYASPPGKQEEPTTCESHFLAISQQHGTESAGSSGDTVVTDGNKNTRADDHILVLGIEALIFTSDSLTTVFVSKADSSGFLSRAPDSTQASSSIIRTVIFTFLEWLVFRNLSTRVPETRYVIRHAAAPPETKSTSITEEAVVSAPASRKRRLVLSLFARSQSQYLFPGSIENATKHVLDDRQLIKWWCRVLDGLVGRNWSTDRHSNTAATLLTSASTDNVNANANANGTSAQAQDLVSASTSINASSTITTSVTPQAYVIVPGCDRSDVVRSFFPVSARHTQSGSIPRWHNSYPDQHLVDVDAWPTEPGSAATIPVRCMIPRLPDDPKARYCDDLDHAGTDDQGRWRDIRSLQQFWETMEYRQECAAGRLVGFIWVVFDTSHLEAKAANGSALAPRNPDLGTTDDRASAVTDPTALSTDPPSKTHEPAPTSLAPASIVLSAEQYNDLADFLVNHTDFAGPELAKRSTKDWINKVREISGAQSFGIDVEGQVPATPPPLRQDSAIAVTQDAGVLGQKHNRDDVEAPKVNVLTGVRKKRKVERETTTNSDGSGVPNANQRQEDRNNEPGTSSGEVRTLSAGLVRKKPKVSDT